MGYTPHVLVVGGGVLGTAIARDFAIRGLDVTLVEQGTLSAGTTGSMQGVLYSGIQFVEDDPSGARRCWTESQTLRRIADHCLETTGGVILPSEAGDILGLSEACEEYGFPVSEVSAEEVDAIAGTAVESGDGVKSPDAVVDPFRLTLANAESARKYGAEIKTGARVVDLLEDGEQIAGAQIEYVDTTAPGRAPTTDPDWETEQGEDEETAAGDTENAPDDDEAAEGDGTDESEAEADESDDEREMPGEVQRSFPGASDDDDADEGEREEIEADFVVNATGAWADRIAALGGIDLPLERRRGTMVVLDGELTDSIVGRPSDDAPLAVTPYQGNTVVGAVSSDGSADPVEQLLDAAGSFVPAVEDADVLRTYSGVWTSHTSGKGTLYGPGGTLIDHAEHDDRWGLLSVVGSTVTTHRLIAEKVADRVCGEFGIERNCLTDELPLPGSSKSDEGASSGTRLLGATQSGRSGGEANPILCESRSVTRETVRAAIDDSEQPTDLRTIKMRTGATMGRCQGGRCSHRIAAELYSEYDAETVETSLDTLLATRWQGRRGALGGEQLALAMRDYELHTRILGRDSPDDQGANFDLFDDGIDDSGGDRDVQPDSALFEHVPQLGFLDPVPTAGDGGPCCSERVVQ